MRRFLSWSVTNLIILIILYTILCQILFVYYYLMCTPKFYDKMRYENIILKLLLTYIFLKKCKMQITKFFTNFIFENLQHKFLFGGVFTTKSHKNMMLDSKVLFKNFVRKLLPKLCFGILNLFKKFHLKPLFRAFYQKKVRTFSKKKLATIIF